MQYSFTEKKRIREFREAPHRSPFLLATQLESFSTFLQADVPATQRKPEGLQAAFTSVFPIVSHNGFARLEFVSYALSAPAFNIKECQQRGSIACAAKVRPCHPRQECRRQGSERAGSVHGRNSARRRRRLFVINGTERVIVSQLHCSPGVFFEHDKARRTARCSRHGSFHRGSWLDFEFDPKDILYFRVDRRRKMPVTILLKAIGLTPEQTANFFVFDNFTLMDEGAQLEFVPERLRGEVALRHHGS